MKYEIIDNFLEKKDFLIIKNTILKNDNFPWYYVPGVAYKNEKKSLFYFVHVFYINHNANSNFFNLLQPILSKINPKALIRIKGNFYPKTEKIFEHKKHVDFKFSNKSMLYYINNNDGFTILENKIKIESKENRALFFDSSFEHNSTTCTNQNGRININFNYL